MNQHDDRQWTIKTVNMGPWSKRVEHLELLDTYGNSRLKISEVPMFWIDEDGMCCPIHEADGHVDFAVRQNFESWFTKTRELLVDLLRGADPDAALYIVRDDLSLAIIHTMGLKGMVYNKNDPRIAQALIMERAKDNEVRLMGQQTDIRGPQRSNHPWYGRHRKRR